MLGLFLVAWVVAPMLVLALSAGLGLLVRRVSAGSPGGVFLLPVGFAAALVIGSLFTEWGATAELTPVALAAGAIAGLVLERRYLLGAVRPSAALLWPAAAAFLGFAVVAAPVVLTGEASFTGYGRIVDLGHHFDFAAYLSSNGRDAVGVADSSFEEVARKILAPGYPGAWHGVLGAVARMLGTDLIWLYQPLLAITSAMGGLAAYGLLGRAVRPPPLRALGGGVAIQANVLYAYGTGGGFKELTAAYLLLLAAGLAAELSPRLGESRAAVSLGVVVAAGVAAFSLGILPWLGVIVGGFVVVTIARSRKRVLAGWATAGAVALALSIPAIIEASKLAPVAAKVEGSSPSARTAIVDLGNLAAAMPVRAASGVWPAPDYRFPSSVAGGLTVVFTILVLGLALAGAVAALRRRDWGLALAAGAGAVGLGYYMARTGPWIQLKAIAITGSLVLACAFAGAVAVGSRLRRGRLVGSILAGVVAVGVLYGNALAYHNASLAPSKRLRDLERIGERYAGQGPTFYPDFEEDAEYLLRREDGVGVVDPAPTRLPQRRAGVASPRYSRGYSTDTDQLRLPYLQSYSLLVRRRGPHRSRPPSNWALVERTRYHEVWRKVRPASTVLVHLPYELRGRSCSRFGAQARRAAHRGRVRVAYVDAPDAVTFRLGRARHTPLWTNRLRRLHVDPDTVAPYGAGEVSGTVAVLRWGDYEFWIAGAFGRAVRFSVDGQPLATLKRMQSYADQYHWVARRDLRAGVHRIRITRGGGNLEPGDRAGADVPLGPMKLVRARPLPVRTAPVRDAERICSRGGLDWLEVVRAGR